MMKIGTMRMKKTVSIILLCFSLSCDALFSTLPLPVKIPKAYDENLDLELEIIKEKIKILKDELREKDDNSGPLPPIKKVFGVGLNPIEEPICQYIKATAGMGAKLYFGVS